MPKADAEIFYSPVGGTPAGVNAFITGASIKGEASAPSASETSNPIEVSITGAAIVGGAGRMQDTGFPLFLLTIPDISLNQGQTISMSQYIVDNDNVITDSQILNLDTSIATYSHATKLLTGVAAGASLGLQLEVTF